MFILPIKSRLQILKEREKPETPFVGKYVLVFVVPTPVKNRGVTSQYRAKNFVRILAVVSKKIHKDAVVRNRIKRRIKEAFRSVDKNCLRNAFDYQIIAKHSIFDVSFSDLVKDIEFCINEKTSKKHRIS